MSESAFEPVDAGGDDYAEAEQALAGTLAADQTDEPAESAGAGYDDTLAAITAREGSGDDAEIDPEVLAAFDAWSLPKGEPDTPPLDPETARAAFEFVQQVAAADDQANADQEHEALTELLREHLDPLAPDFVHNQLAFQRMLSTGTLKMDEAGRLSVDRDKIPPEDVPVNQALQEVAALAPDLDPQAVFDRANALIDPIEAATGLTGREAAEAAIREAAARIRAENATDSRDRFEYQRFARDEERHAETRVYAAEAKLERLLDSADDPSAVRARMAEIFEPLRAATGKSGDELVREAFRQAVEDLSPTDSYDEAQRKINARVQAGLPPLVSVPGRTDAASVAVAERPVFDSYDEVENYHRSLAKRS